MLVAIGGTVLAMLGWSSSAAAAVPAGSVDRAFGTNGSTVLPQPRGAGADPSFIVAGLLGVGSSRLWTSGESGPVAAVDYTMRFTTSGKPDPAFRHGTPYIGPLNADSGGAEALVTTPDGGAVVATGLYGCCNGSFLSFTRLTQSGYVNKAFGNGGRLWYHDVPGGCGDDDSLSVYGGGVRLSNGTYRFAGQMYRCGSRSGLTSDWTRPADRTPRWGSRAWARRPS